MIPKEIKTYQRNHLFLLDKIVFLYKSLHSQEEWRCMLHPFCALEIATVAVSSKYRIEASICLDQPLVQSIFSKVKKNERIRS